MKTKFSFIVVMLVTLSLVSCSDKEKAQTKVKEVNSQVEAEVSELVRTGIIDVVSIDNNNDGKIYECPMDWNVISDEAVDCPVCGMNLKEYSLAETKENLQKFGHKVK